MLTLARLLVLMRARRHVFFLLTWGSKEGFGVRGTSSSAFCPASHSVNNQSFESKKYPEFLIHRFPGQNAAVTSVSYGYSDGKSSQTILKVSNKHMHTVIQLHVYIYINLNCFRFLKLNLFLWLDEAQITAAISSLDTL